MITRFTAVFVLTLCFISPLLAQEIGLGMALAPMGGHGFSIRMLDDDGMGLQAGTIF